MININQWFFVYLYKLWYNKVIYSQYIIMAKQPEEIKYIDDKLKKALIIESDWNNTLIPISKNINQIKNIINDILDCTDIYQKIQNKIQERKIYKLWKIITKHLFWSIDNSFSYDKKKEIIKNNIIKNINSKNNIVILINENRIIIIDTWRDKNQLNPEKRFNWFSNEETDLFIEENLDKNFEAKEILIEILDEIDFKKMDIKTIISFINNDYKWYLVHWYISKLWNKYKIEKDILKAISWKLLRENFNIAKEYIANIFFDEILEKRLNQKNIQEEINQELKTELNNKIINLNFEKFNIKKIYINYYISLTNIIYNKIQSFFNSQLKIDTFIKDKLIKNYIKYILKTKEDDLKNILLEKMVKTIIENISNINNKIVSKNIVNIFNILSKNNPEIKLNFDWKYYNLIKIKNELWSINSKNSINKNDIEKINSLKQKYKIDNKYSKKEIQKKLDKNTKIINELLKSTEYTNIDWKNLSIIEMKEKIQQLREEISKIDIEIKKIKSNFIKKNLNIIPLKRLNEKKLRREKLIINILKIIKLLENNNNLKNFINEQEENQKQLKQLEKKEKIIQAELKNNNEKLKAIKEILIEMIKEII